MMKKFMALMMSMMLVLSLAACGGTEETVSDAAPVESVAEDVAESVEEDTAVETTVEEEIASEEEADTVSSLWDLANAETPDLAGTTWSFVGGCLDGVEMEQEELDYTLEQYGGKLDLAFAEDGTVQMVQGAGAWDGTYEYLEDGGISMNIDADGTALNYTGIFSMVGDQLVLMLLNAGDAEGLNGLYFVQ